MDSSARVQRNDGFPLHRLYITDPPMPLLGVIQGGKEQAADQECSKDSTLRDDCSQIYKWKRR